MKPKAMPSVIENANGIVTSVRNDATAAGGSARSIRATLRIMKLPTMMRAGATIGWSVASPTGTPWPAMRASGAQKRATRKSPAVTTLASPVRAPACTPAALSTRKPACSATPTSVPTVSKRPRKKRTKTTCTRSGHSAAPRSRHAKVGASDGGGARMPWKRTKPARPAASPVARVPITIAPGARRASSAAVRSVPPIATRVGGAARRPRPMIVPGTGRTIPAHSKPTSAISRPIPAAIACFSESGMASIRRSRRPTSERTRKAMPARQLVPSATCQP